MTPPVAHDLAGKAVLITGASTGIGAAAARAFASMGARVALHYHASAEPATRIAQEIADAGGEAHLVRADFAQSAQVRRAVEEAAAALGGLDVLVNNAGGLVSRATIDQVDDALFDQVIDLNVRSVVAACAAAVPHLKTAGGGSIINVTSIAARNGGGHGAALYASAKAFVSTFTRGLAKELAGDGIRVNAIAPGVILTPFHDRFSTPEMLEQFKASIPMRRLGTPDDCVGAFLFLAAPSWSGYMTGQILEVNGGQYMP